MVFLLFSYRLCLFFGHVVTSSVQVLHLSIKCGAKNMEGGIVKELEIGTPMLTQLRLQTTNQLVESVGGIWVSIPFAHF